MGVTAEGYKRRTYDEILADKIELCKNLFGEDIDTSDLTPLGKFIRINAYDQSTVEEEAEQIYYSIFPHTATGTSLDRLCPFVGITRNPATASRYIVKVTGTAGETVPMDFTVATESGVKFQSLGESVIGEDGTCEILVECKETGTMGNVAVTDITVIVNPDEHITSVVGVVDEEWNKLGTDLEDDVSLRKRFEQAIASAGSSNEAAITSALMAVSGVTSASIVVDEDNHSFTCYVAGGDDTEVAKAILAKKPLGIKTSGTTTVEDIEDSGGYLHDISFSRITNIPVSISCKIKVSALFESTGKTEICDNIMDYINGLGVGNSVVLSSLYGKIHAVTGVTEVTELKMSKDGGNTYTTDNIDISIYEIAQCTDVDIEVVA